MLFRMTECVRFVRGLADARRGEAAMKHFLTAAKERADQMQLVRGIPCSRYCGSPPVARRRMPRMVHALPGGTSLRVSGLVDKLAGSC